MRRLVRGYARTVPIARVAFTEHQHPAWVLFEGGLAENTRVSARRKPLWMRSSLATLHVESTIWDRGRVPQPLAAGKE